MPKLESGRVDEEERTRIPDHLTGSKWPVAPGRRGKARLFFLSAAGFLLALTVLTGCHSNEPPAPETASETTAPYDFSHPSATFILPTALIEVSGLTLLDSLHLGAIQDENGTLYVLDARSGIVEREVAFGQNGDYEGVERMNDIIYILRSDGALFTIQSWESTRPRSRALATKLPGGCDAEGLASDAANDRLLIACKGSTDAGGEHIRQIYAFDLPAQTLNPHPTHLLSARRIAQSPDYDRMLDRVLRDLTAPFTDLSGFTPSAMAVEPQSGHLLVVSSSQKALVVLDTSGLVVDLWHLPERLFPQPEGIAVAPDGTLYVSNEGSGGAPATILVFRPALDQPPGTEGP